MFTVRRIQGCFWTIDSKGELASPRISRRERDKREKMDCEIQK